MAEAAEAENPFAQFMIPDTKPESPEEPNPFAQFVQPDEVMPEHRAGRAPSRVIGVGPEGIPVFENEEDNKALQTAGNLLLKGLGTQLLGVPKGINDVVMGINQLGARGAEAALPEGSKAKAFMTDQRQRVESDIADIENRYKEAGGGSAGPDVGRFAGNVIATAPLAALIPGGTATGLIPRIAAAGAGGAASGALEPVSQPGNDFWQQKAQQAGAGAVGGAVTAPVAGALGRVISPNVSPEVQRLMEAGVRPTPGQIMGGVTNRLEEAAQSIPFVGDAIKAARGRATGDLNRAAIDQALEPIGERLDAKTPTGREAISEMHDKITANYGRIVPHLNVQLDQPFVNDVWNLNSTLRAKMPDPAQEQLDRLLKHDVFHYFDQHGQMTGEDFKRVEGELGRQATSFSTSTNAQDKMVGEALAQMRQHMRDLLVRSNPQYAPQLQAANEAFARSVRVEGAAGSVGAEKGIFSPAHLVNAIKQSDRSVRKSAFARGDALMQDLGDAGKVVLGNKVPDSGTPLRSAIMAAPALAGLYAWNPAVAAATTGAGLAAMGAYSRPGVSALAKLLASRGPAAPAIAGAVRWPGNASLPAILAAQQMVPQQAP